MAILLSRVFVGGFAVLAGLGCKPEAASPSQPRGAPAPAAAPSAASCDGPALTFDVESEGPFASLMAMCALHRAGNDAPRICHEDIGAASLARPRLAPSSAIRNARVVAYDRGGDYVFCNLALETAFSLPRNCCIYPDRGGNHPDLASSELPSASEAFRQLAEVLATGETARYSPTMSPNTHWQNWPDGGTL